MSTDCPCGVYQQQQDLPLLVFDGDSQFPLAGGLRAGTAHASAGAVETLQELVPVPRAAWPEVEIVVRGDSGYAVPAVYEFCEAHGLKYVIGYATNEVLKARTHVLMNYVQAVAELHGEPLQRFQELRDYPAGSWDRPRRVIAKCEVTESGGSNRRFVVTNLTERPEPVYREVYVQRGDTPERASEELQHGLGIDRLSSHRFFAHAFTLQCHRLAYALCVRFREAHAAVPEVAGHTLETVRARVLYRSRPRMRRSASRDKTVSQALLQAAGSIKLGAVLRVSARKVWFHASATWPGRALFVRVCAAVEAFAQRCGRLWTDRLAERLALKLGGPVTLLKSPASGSAPRRVLLVAPAEGPRGTRPKPRPKRCQARVRTDKPPSHDLRSPTPRAPTPRPPGRIPRTGAPNQHGAQYGLGRAAARP